MLLCHGDSLATEQATATTVAPFTLLMQPTQTAEKLLEWPSEPGGEQKLQLLVPVPSWSGEVLECALGERAQVSLGSSIKQRIERLQERCPFLILAVGAYPTFTSLFCLPDIFCAIRLKS